MNEMVAIYRKAYKKKEAADVLYQLAALKMAAKDLTTAKTLLDDALKLNPEHADAKKGRDRVKLELTYQSLAPVPSAQPVTPPRQVESPGIPAHLSDVPGYLTPVDRVLAEAELHGRSKAELRVMRNEVYARHGRTFEAPDLQNYFSRKPWYRQNPSYSDGLLTETDKANVKALQDFENGMQ
jgi:DNA-binding FrmR family transcriptional regulator